MSEESFHSEHPAGWIEWYCSLEDHNFLLEVDEDFIEDPINSFDFKDNYTQFENAFEMILQPEMPESNDLSDPKFLEIYQEAIEIYGLFHAKYIQTPIGLAILRERVLQGRYGQCPRVYCEQQNVIPVGLSEQPKTSRVKVYCPRCEDAYAPKKKFSDMDGAYFGKTLPTLLLMTHHDLVPQIGNLRDIEYKKFAPTVFGFKVYGKNGSNYDQFKTMDNKSQEVTTLKECNLLKEEIFKQDEQKPNQIQKENITQSKKKRKNQKA